MVAYDSKLLYQFAEQLYARAKQLVIVSAVTGAVLGAAVGFGVMEVRPHLGAVAIVSFAALFAWVGFSSAQQKAFLLRLEAQQLLVQAKIEENTRK